jgi:capsular exopolysaccharide synthesis family protein
MRPLRIETGPHGLPYNIEFVFQYTGDENFRLYTSSRTGLKLDTVAAFGQELRIVDKAFTIYPIPEMEDVYKSGERIYFQFYEVDRLVQDYSKSIMVENATRDGSIVRITHENTNEMKGRIFLSKLTEVFIKSNLEKKNFEAERIIEFIEGQLTDVRDSLDLTETELQEFRSQNRIMDVSAQTQQIINQAVVLENEQAKLNLEKSYYHYLEEYLSEDNIKNNPIAPASMGITDPNLTNLIQEFSSLQAEYFSSGVGERNPMQGQLEMRIRNIKRSIKETLSGIMQANEMAINENKRQIERLNGEASRLPAKEQQLLGFERRFNLNNVMYTFLLERRAEAQIQMASNTADHEIVDPARSVGIVSPVPLTVLAFALSFAIVIPSLILLIINSLFNIRISNEEDIQFISNHPILAQFPHNRLSYYNVIFTDPTSAISEAFRSLRTRMEFFTKDIKCPVIVVSSSTPGEGKTYVAINLASVYSLLGMKTLLVGYDFRRPTISKGFELPHEYGSVDYLIGRKELKEVIVESGHDNLDILPSGSIPPNPSELSGSEKSKKLFSLLRAKYDCIIVDSAPVGVVSDIIPVVSSADVMLMVVRHGYTLKNALRATLSDLQGLHIDNIGLLINDVSLSNNSYRYNYKYKYEYGIKTKSRKIWPPAFLKRADKTTKSNG